MLRDDARDWDLGYPRSVQRNGWQDRDGVLLQRRRTARALHRGHDLGPRRMRPAVAALRSSAARWPLAASSDGAPAQDRRPRVAGARPARRDNCRWPRRPPKASASRPTSSREEVAARTGLALARVTGTWPAGGPVVAVDPGGDAALGRGPARRPMQPANWPEGYRLVAREQAIARLSGSSAPIGAAPVRRRRAAARPRLGSWRRLAAARSRCDHRAALPAARSPARVPPPLEHLRRLERPRSTDRYIRELALFGANAIENIPFHDTRPAPLMPISRAAMARRISEICAKYRSPGTGCGRRPTSTWRTPRNASRR